MQWVGKKKDRDESGCTREVTMFQVEFLPQKNCRLLLLYYRLQLTKIDKRL